MGRKKQKEKAKPDKKINKIFKVAPGHPKSNTTKLTPLPVYKESKIYGHFTHH